MVVSRAWPDVQQAILETPPMVGIAMFFTVPIGVPAGLLLFLSAPAG
jgi:ABC-type methionine transport system permease subunit